MDMFEGEVSGLHCHDLLLLLGAPRMPWTQTCLLLEDKLKNIGFCFIGGVSSHGGSERSGELILKRNRATGVTFRLSHSSEFTGTPPVSWG